MKVLVLFGIVALVAGDNGDLESSFPSLLKSFVLDTPEDSPLESPVESFMEAEYHNKVGIDTGNQESPWPSLLKSFASGIPLDSGIPLESPIESPIDTDYHYKVGIPAAERIRAAEEAVDFDGARIVGGTPAILGQYPYAGGLVITLTTGATSVCGCTLLSNTRALTSANCWRSSTTQALSFTVVLGSVRLFHGGTRVHTTDVEMHANFNANTLIYNIAMIRIPFVDFNPNIQPISLAVGNFLYTGSWASVAGFGRTRDGLAISNDQYLSHVSVQVISNAACASTYGTGTVRDTTLCTATWGGRGTCLSDAGGPLVVYTEQLGWHLIGLGSFVHSGGCQRNHPVGFSRITSFTSWIWPRL